TKKNNNLLVGQTYSFGAGKRDMYLIKADSNGDTIWTKTYGGANYEYGRDAIELKNGGFLVVGRTKSFGAGGNDIYLAKIDSNGFSGGCNEGNASPSVVDPNITKTSGMQVNSGLSQGSASTQTGSTSMGDSTMCLTNNDNPCLKAYYPFNGNANDESGWGYDGTVMNGANLTTDRFGNDSSAYYFDGVDDYINIGDPLSGHSGSVSISVWILHTKKDTADSQVFIGKKPGGCWCEGRWQIGINKYQAPGFCYATTSGNNCTNKGNGVSKYWQHYVLIENGTNLEFYKNG
ncbi:MAG: LamG-like jellyroll fold domain-containing protein, partial [Flavobacteriales bacterium]